MMNVLTRACITKYRMWCGPPGILRLPQGTKRFDDSTHPQSPQLSRPRIAPLRDPLVLVVKVQRLRGEVRHCQHTEGEAGGLAEGIAEREPHSTWRRSIRLRVRCGSGVPLAWVVGSWCTIHDSPYRSKVRPGAAARRRKSSSGMEPGSRADCGAPTLQTSKTPGVECRVDAAGTRAVLKAVGDWVALCKQESQRAPQLDQPWSNSNRDKHPYSRIEAPASHLLWKLAHLWVSFCSSFTEAAEPRPSSIVARQAHRPSRRIMLLRETPYALSSQDAPPSLA